jgi:catechol 2,3-dioxygenase-like lactoylglutathione lyase family enzyme
LVRNDRSKKRTIDSNHLIFNNPFGNSILAAGSSVKNSDTGLRSGGPRAFSRRRGARLIAGRPLCARLDLVKAARLDHLPVVDDTFPIGSNGGDGPVSIVLDHTIVPALDKEESARFFARIFDLSYEGAVSHFAPVRVNETLTLDFDTDTDFRAQHFAFKVSEAEFDGIFERIKRERIPYGSGPFTPEDMKINRHKGGRGFYFRDPGGHLLEVLTA